MTITAVRKREIEAMRLRWLAEHSGLSTSHITLIEHYDPRAMTDSSLVDSLPPDWHERYERVCDWYVEMLELRLALVEARDFLAESVKTNRPVPPMVLKVVG
jgi:hypothetical protein